MINVNELTKYYGSRLAIEALTFNAERGEILGFLGPNGAGKTTTMRILTGYMPPTSGTVEIGGFDVMEQSLQVRRLVGYLPETVPLYPEMSVFEYLKFMADLRNVQNVRERVGETLEMVRMQDRAASLIGSLSKGMRQRVGLAQALIHQPEVLILDEPTIGLDPAQIIEVRKLIQEIGRERTVLLSTHILSEAQQVCNRVLIINKGRIVAEDTPGHLQSRLTGAQHVALRIRGESDELAALLEHIPGVVSVNSNRNGTLEIEAAPGQDPRPELARAVISAGLDLLEMRQETMSLEEIFLQLTREEPSSPSLEEPGEADLVEER